MDKPKFIVAEVTKNWDGENMSTRNIISKQFELVINSNLGRGYSLKEWKYNSIAGNTGIVETIVAIFELTN